MNAKILSQKRLIVVSKLLKEEKVKISAVSGSFDILHLGHIKFLKEAKKKGDVLFVLVNSDKSIKGYKGPNRPIINEKSRMEMLAAMSCVDYVCLFDELNPNEVIKKIKPDIYCNGSDWGKNCIERETVKNVNGKIFVIKRKKTEETTSEIIKKIIDKYKKPIVKAVFIDRDGTINDNKIGYTYKINNFFYLPGVINSLKKISKTDYKIIIITNQSGIGRGYFTINDYEKLTKHMLSFFRNNKIRIDKVYFCPHKPGDDCVCRKPKIGMLMKAVEDFKISLNDSWLIGDDDKDVFMGREANLRTIKIGRSNSKIKIMPNFTVGSLSEAINIVLKKD